MSKTFADWFGEDLTGQTYDGYINCSYQGLTSLKGAPKEVTSGFDCGGNQLTSLEGAPQYVRGGFYCQGNNLTSLEGAPQQVEYNFDCSKNKLTSLKGSPQVVKGSFSCNKNKLTSLKGGPQEVGSDSEIGLDLDSFDCRYNNLTSLEGAPRIVKGDFWCTDNKLTSLDCIGEVTGQIYSDFDKNSDTDLDDDFDDDFDDDDGYLTNDQLKVGSTYALVLDKGYNWTLSEVDDFDLTEEEIQRLEDAGWLNEYREVVIPDEEPFVFKAKGAHGDSIYFPSVDITFDGLVGGDDDLYYKVESRRNKSKLSTTESKLLRKVEKILND